MTSFSSISFEAETARRLKELSDKRDESHSQTLRLLLDAYGFWEGKDPKETS